MHRIEHNQKLRTEWFAARNLRIGNPPIHEQLPTILINRRALFPYGYNPSIIEYQGRTLCAYRYHANGHPASSLAMAELDDQFRVTSNGTIDLPPGSMEDPRLFIYGGHLCISYVISTVPQMPLRSVVRWGILVPNGKSWTIEGQWLIQHGKNDNTAMEKNWVFYEQEGTLRVIYRSSPDVELLAVDQERVLDVDTKPHSVWWKWGPFKGGTKPFKLSDGRTIRFFHSRLDNEPRPMQWRYYVGAAVTDNGNIVAVSKRPILKGSEHDDMGATDKASCSHYKPNVVFPTGAIQRDGKFYLSVGINDALCGVVMIEEKDLNL